MFCSVNLMFPVNVVMDPDRDVQRFESFACSGGHVVAARAAFMPLSHEIRG